MSNCKTNTDEVRSRIEAAAQKYFEEDVDVFFDEGQWWVLANREEKDDLLTYAVMDWDGDDSIDGYTFARV